MEYTRKEIRKGLEAWARDAYDDEMNEQENLNISDYETEDDYVKACVECLFSYLDKQ